MDCYCDYEPARFYFGKRLTARAQHTCFECGRKIMPGENYERVVGMWDSKPEVFKTCSYCLDIRQFVKNSVPCFCWAHGSLLDDAAETVSDAYWAAREEVKGLFMGYGRLKIKQQRARRSFPHPTSGDQP